MQVKTKNIAVIALAALLVLTLWYRMLYSSYTGQASKANQAAQDAEQRVSTIERQVRKLEGDKTDKEKADATNELKNAIPVTPELANFLRATDNIRRESGVGFQSITPSTPTLVGGVQTINVGIVVQGEYAQVVHYLDALTALKRLVVIDNVGFSTSGGGSSDASGASAGGGPTGEVFAGSGAAPTLQAQLTARLFSQAAVVTGTGTGTSGSPSSGSGGSSGGGASSSAQTGGPTALPPGVHNN